jgi:cation diffusion facilitator CzcD-associated flavoprotein CzcO
MTVIANRARGERDDRANGPDPAANVDDRGVRGSDGSSATPHHRVAIVGAGFSGLGTAARLREAGIEDFVVLEKAADVGGTWQANTYPGCQCDVPSHLYSFSFAPNPDWTSTFSLQPEIWEYLRRVADERRLREKIRFGVQLTRADWMQDEQLWRLETTAGEMTAQILVSGMGALAEPAMPDIPGLSSFAGPCFHSARWNHEVDLRGKRVAVIGTGASAIQIVPKIQPEVAALRLFQRTPPWIMPHPDRRISALERRLYNALPKAQRAVREGIYWGRELYVLPFLHPLLAKPGERIAARHLAAQVRDPALRAKLTPRYRIGCKRILLSDEYYPAIQEENVQVVTEPIERVTPGGIATRDGAEHELDAIVLTTGFHVTDVPFAPLIHGRDGRSLAETWNGSPKTHLGTTVAGFPNLFLLLGPYTALGHTSVVFMIECQIAYLMDCIATMERRRIRSIEPTAAAQGAFLAEMWRRAKGTVWSSGGCASWYLDADGRPSAIWPGPTWRFRRRLRRFHSNEYVLRPQTLPASPRPAATRGAA